MDQIDAVGLSGFEDQYLVNCLEYAAEGRPCETLATNPEILLMDEAFGA